MFEDEVGLGSGIPNWLRAMDLGAESLGHDWLRCGAYSCGGGWWLSLSEVWLAA